MPKTLPTRPAHCSTTGTSWRRSRPAWQPDGWDWIRGSASSMPTLPAGPRSPAISWRQSGRTSMPTCSMCSPARCGSGSSSRTTEAWCAAWRRSPIAWRRPCPPTPWPSVRWSSTLPSCWPRRRPMTCRCRRCSAGRSTRRQPANVPGKAKGGPKPAGPNPGVWRHGENAWPNRHRHRLCRSGCAGGAEVSCGWIRTGTDPASTGARVASLDDAARLECQWRKAEGLPLSVIGNGPDATDTHGGGPDNRDRRPMPATGNSKRRWSTSGTGDSMDPGSGSTRRSSRDWHTFSLPTIAKATGSSTDGASQGRSGKKRPHPRHWEALVPPNQKG